MQVKNLKKTTKRKKSGKKEPEDHLITKRKGGGSIIDHRPLFSSNGELLYVVWKHVIRKYSTQTGDFVGEFEAAEVKLSGISFYSDNFNTIVGCTETGDLINWNSQNGVITRKLKLKTEDEVRISTFHIINYKSKSGKSINEALVTYTNKSSNSIHLGLFDVETGSATRSRSIPCGPTGAYCVDIVGNNGDNLIALAQDVDLHVIQPLNDLKGKLHKIGLTGRKLTCVTGHPEEECVAVGDSSGRVLVYRNLLQRPVMGSYHWHTLPVTEIAFSKSGGHMYTGGSECVLVKWTLANPHHKSFLPRLPAPIKHLTIAPENIYVAVSTLDNGIVVVNPQKKLTSVIQNFTWGVTASSRGRFPAGLILDPRTGSLVLNSRTGHVQFFDTHRKSLLYNINITAQNFLTQERAAVIVNTEVTRVSINQDGAWMATVEERDDRVSTPEVRLKFWRFNSQRQIFSLNTCIELPHELGINALGFQPSGSLDGEGIAAVTTGRDRKFKIWGIVEGTGDRGKHWACYGVESYRDLQVTDAGFSVDGSLLGVGFGSSLTIWGPEDMALKCSLTHRRYPQVIKRVEFGKNESCHLVVVGSDEHIGVWNLLTLSLTWSVHLKLQVLVADPCTNLMAAFSRDNSLFIFNPQVSTPIYVRRGVLEGESVVLGACYVPNDKEKRGKGLCEWQRESQLFFIDDNQELLALEDEREGGVLFEGLGDRVLNWPSTPFGRIIAEESTNNVQRASFVHDHLGTGKGVVEELLTLPAHTLPPMRLLCGPFILSLRAKPGNKRKNNDDKTSSDANSESENSDDSDEDDGIDPRNHLAIETIPTDVRRLNDNDDNDAKLVSLDWSFLARIVPS
ncbi:WD repeat-containing protein 75 [Fopius arisanus]|uniref:WD repeat-containing protein 75 n=1 Tax=Fopius arisanus TaxID=64838 RepID=A0A0C9QGV3_9HYME|nr:PREDICTED: WD repeat-containing protein 75 [Fopius arisanus]